MVDRSEILEERDMFRTRSIAVIAAAFAAVLHSQPSSAAMIRADFAAVFDSGAFTNNPGMDLNCDSLHVCNWSALVGQTAAGSFLL